MSWYWILQLWEQNQDALISLPTEVKTIMTISIVICLLSGIIRKAAKLLRVAIIVAIVYFACTYFGII